MERSGGGGGNVNVNGGTSGIITIVTSTTTNQNQNQSHIINNNIINSNFNTSGSQPHFQQQTVPQSQVLPSGLALVRPPVSVSSSSILQDALRGQRSALFQPQQAGQIHQVFYHQPLQQQQAQVQHPQSQSQSEEMDANSPLGNKTREELTNQIFQKYFQRHRNIDQASFRNEERSVQKAFFDFVVNVPIFIDGHKVSRKAWAKAFYEMDVIQSAKCLFEALFDKEEMSKCTLNGKNGTEELSAVKMLAIMRASCWMKNKEQDPYSFNPENLSHNVFPSKDERDKIEKKVFTERRSQANRKIVKAGTKRPHNRMSPQDKMDTSGRLSGFEGDSDSQHSEPSHMDTQDNESIKSEGSLEGNRFVVNLNGNNESWEKKPLDDLELEELYYRYPDEFLEKLLPNRSEILIDGILIPELIWDRAFRESEKDTVKAAWTLFQFLFSNDEIMNCTLNGKNGTTELCPVRKLAIIRAVQWMSKNASDSSTKSRAFDSDIDSCNLFPSEEDKERIETKVFTEKRYQHSRQLNTKFGVANNITNNATGRIST